MFLVVTLGLNIYKSVYQNLPQIYTNLIQGDTEIFLYNSVNSSPFCALLYTFIYICYKSSITLLELSLHIIFMSLKRAETRKKRKYLFIEFGIFFFVLTISGSPHLFLWIQVTIRCHFHIPIQLWSYPPPLSVLSNILLHFYVL